MARLPSIITLVAGSALMSGCVAQDKYNALKLDRDGKAEQLTQSQTDLSGARAEADSYKNQLQQLAGNGNNKEALVESYRQQLDAMRASNDELTRKYGDAMNRPSGAMALPEPLSNALSSFAQQNPDLVDFDASKGVVKFRSDVTFATGDAALTDKAKEAINRFATILNSAAASGYELMVAGHTDNQPVSNPKTKAAGHKDNWYLSAHRAISVGDELISQHVNSQRIAIVGYADQRPMTSNATPAGQAQNRRVEVLILPTTVKSGASMAGGASKPPMKKPPMNKDTGTIEKPVLNK